MPRSRYDDDDDRDDDRRSRRRDDDDGYDAPPPVEGGTGMAMASLILGILSICAGPLTGLIGGILGLMSMGKPRGKGMAVTGLILSTLFSIGWIVGGIFLWMWAQESQKRYVVSNNFKQAGVGTHNYHDQMGYLPSPYEPGTRPTTGQPPSDLNDRLSWRVTLLPFMEQSYLHNQFDLNQPWNSSKNQPLSSTVVTQYADPDTPTDPTTRLRCFYDNGAVFDTKYGRVRLADIFDGTSNTIFYVEGGEKVTWSKFGEYKFEPNGPLPALGRADKPDFMVAMADGSVRRVKKTVNEQALKAAITRAGGEVSYLD